MREGVCARVQRFRSARGRQEGLQEAGFWFSALIPRASGRSIGAYAARTGAAGRTHGCARRAWGTGLPGRGRPGQARAVVSGVELPYTAMGGTLARADARGAQHLGIL